MAAAPPPAAGAAPAAESFLFLGSTGWLGVAFLLFLVLLWRFGAFAALIRALDAQGANVRAALGEAEALRAEAEALKDRAAAEAREAAEQAQAILANAEAEAARILARAAEEADAAVARRRRLAEERIEAARRAAEESVRARVADLSLEAARQLLAAEAEAGRLRHLTDHAIESLDRA